MRRLLYIIIGVIVLAVTGTSCENKSLTRQLDDLDTLMRVSPDSVYAVLDGMDTRNMSKRQRMRHALLLADAQNKAYIDFTTDSAMIAVVDYYDHHGTPNEQMRAHYLLGCTYRDMGDAPMELQCFLDATEKADTADKDCDLYTLAAIYGQMADIYHSQYLPEEELKTLEKCERIAWMDNDTLSAIKAYELRIRPYYLLDNQDSVLSISKKAYHRYSELGYIEEAAGLLGPTIDVMIKCKNYKEAKLYLDIFENNYDGDTASVKNNSLYYHSKGRLFLADNKLDSAFCCFYKLLGSEEKEAAYHGLLSLFEETDYSDSISKYAKLYAAANDSSYINKNTEAIAQMTAMYNYGRQEKIAKQKTIESAKAKKQVYFISMIAVLIFFVSLILYVYLRYKTKEREKLYLTQEKTLLKRYNETKEIIANLEKEMSSLEVQKEEASVASKSHIEELLLTINNYEKEKEELVSKLKGFNQINEDLDFKAWYEDFISCDVTNKLHAKTIVTPNMVVTIEDNLWNELREQIMKHCPAFLNIIDSYSLNPTYQHIVILNIFDFSTSEISVLLNKTVQQISNIHNRISKKIFPSSNETRKLKQNLQEILRDKRIKKS